MVYVCTQICYHYLYEVCDIETVTQVVFISVNKFHTVCAPIRAEKISLALVCHRDWDINLFTSFTCTNIR